MDELSVEFIESSLKSPWDFGNSILYDLCSQFPLHEHTPIIIAKTQFIGRIYAAAIERRRKQLDDSTAGDDFYIKTIASTFKNSNFDFHIKKLKELNPDHIFEILEAHKKLVDMLTAITGLEKRSFASKYLHFHFDSMFFIYDSRAVNGLKKYVNRVPKEYNELIVGDDVDTEYAKFFCKCHYLQKLIRGLYSKAPEMITPRVIDNILLR